MSLTVLGESNKIVGFATFSDQPAILFGDEFVVSTWNNLITEVDGRGSVFNVSFLSCSLPMY